MCFVPGCLHQEDSSGAARRPWLAGESHNGKTWLLSRLDMISLLPLCSTQIPLYSEVTDETSYELWLLMCFIKGGTFQIHSKQSDYIFYDSIWVTWYLCSRPSKANPVTCSCSKPHFLSGKMYGHQQFKSKPVCDVPPFRGRSVVCPQYGCWAAPELGDGFRRVLHCPELFFECKKGCRLEFCTLPRHCIHSALSHCSAPKNLGNQRKESVNDGPLIFLISRQNQEMKKGTEKCE